MMTMSLIQQIQAFGTWYALMNTLHRQWDNVLSHTTAQYNYTTNDDTVLYVIEIETIKIFM